MYNLVQPGTLEALRRNCRQQLRIAVETVNEEFELTEENIVQGSCTIDRYTCNGDKIEIGTAIAAELKLELKADVILVDDYFMDVNDILFEGAVMQVFCRIQLESGYEDIPLGRFVVDMQERKQSTITIAALDNMMKLDAPFDGAVGSSLLALAQHLCTLSNVTLSSNAVAFLQGFNGKYTLPVSIPQNNADKFTCRQIMKQIGELVCGCWYADMNGEINIKPLPDDWTGAFELTEADRYNSTIQESDITVTGITAIDGEGNETTAGQQGYEFSIDGNKLLTNPAQLGSALGLDGNSTVFTYRPFTASTFSYPQLHPLDPIIFYKDGTPHNSVITHHTWKLNGASDIKSVGKSGVRNGYAKLSPFTAKQRAIIERIAAQVTPNLSGFEQATIQLNERMANAMGMYITNVTDANGGNIFYYHNSPQIENSTYIVMESSVGRAWTTGANCWNNGSPIWTSGYTDTGEMIMQAIAARKITVDLLNIAPRTAVVNNMLSNGGFTNGTDGWEVFCFNGSSHFTTVGEPVYSIYTESSGNRYLSLGTPISSNIVRNVARSYAVPIKSNTKYSVGFTVQASSSTSNIAHVYCEVQIARSGNSKEVYTFPDSSEKPSKTSETRYEYSFTSPADATSVRLFLCVDRQTDTNAKYYFDSVMLNEGDPLPYDDADNPTDNGGGNVSLDSSGISVYNGAFRLYSSATDGNISIDSDGVSIYNGAFNLYAPGGGNVVHFDGNNRFCIDASNHFDINFCNVSTLGGDASFLLKFPTESIYNYSSENFVSADTIKDFNAVLPHLVMSISNPTTVDPTTGNADPTPLMFNAELCINPKGMVIAEDDTETRITGGHIAVKGTVDETPAYVTISPGGVYSSLYGQLSDADIKSRITPATDMLAKICAADVCNYAYKSEENSAESNEPPSEITLNGGDVELPAPHYGLVIGEGYNTPEEIITKDGKHIDLYAMITLAWKGIQELAAKVNELEMRIESIN